VSQLFELMSDTLQERLIKCLDESHQLSFRGGHRPPVRPG
jgi:hypothetical protein